MTQPALIKIGTGTDIDTIMIAMELLKKIGLIKILEDGAIFIEQVQKNDWFYDRRCY